MSHFARPARSAGALVAFALLVLASAPWAQRMQLSAPLEQVVAGKVLDQRVSADGSFLVYVADPLANARPCSAPSRVATARSSLARVGFPVRAYSQPPRGRPMPSWA